MYWNVIEKGRGGSRGAADPPPLQLEKNSIAAAISLAKLSSLSITYCLKDKAYSPQRL